MVQCEANFRYVFRAMKLPISHPERTIIGEKSTS